MLKEATKDNPEPGTDDFLGVGWVDETFCLFVEKKQDGAKTDWLGQQKNYLLKTNVLTKCLNT